MKTIKFSLLLFCSVFSSLFGQMEEAKAVLDSIGNEINEAALSGDYEKMISHFAEDVVVFPVLNPPIKGKEAYRESLKNMNEKEVEYKSISGNTTDLWECGNMVYQIGTFGISLVTKDSPKPVAYYGSFFHVWQKQSDGYKLKYMMSNFDFNPFGNDVYEL